MKIRLLLLLATLSLAAARADEFPAIYNSEKDPSLPMPAAEAAQKMELPKGFKASVFAAEPDVQNPIAMTWDARGRLWVVENYTYAEPPKRFDLSLRDRVLIFEDKNGDGHFSSRKVFTDDVQMATSVEVGFGGVWLMCPPRLLFIPSKNGDKPDGPPQVVLDGFTVAQEQYHNFANGLRWGPDGWLYGRCGGSCPGRIGAPGTPDAARTPLNGGIWRWHPTRKIFEVLSHGTTNPWGLDWDANGEAFYVNTVQGHFFHLIPGAHYIRHNTDPNPRAYSLIDTHADHYHWNKDAELWSEIRTKGTSDTTNHMGGGHAHCGAMVYLADNWPAEYRGHFFTLNYHGRRVNQDILGREGSGYVAKHGTDFLQAADPWFRGIDLRYGPDGGVFVLDWNDIGECHDRTGVYRTSGRIFKITYGEPKKVEVGDLSKLGDLELVKLQLHPNEWFARQARRLLQERAAAGEKRDEARQELLGMFEKQTDIALKLRALWSLHAIGATDEKFLRTLLKNGDEHMRAWAIRLLTEFWPIDTVMSHPPLARPPVDRALLEDFIRMAREDGSGLVRLVLASTLQRLPPASRPQLAAALLSHPEDANDHNMPLLVWYGLISVADTNPVALVSLAMESRIPLTRKLITRRLTEEIESNPAPLNALLTAAAKSSSEPLLADIVAGLADGLRGWRKARKPAAWDALQTKLADAKDTGLRDRTRELAVVFGDGRALDEIQKLALTADADLAQRQGALQTLIDNHAPDLQKICEQLLNVQVLNRTAVRGLALFDDPAIAEKLIKYYYRFYPPDRPAVISTLASRAVFAKALLNAIAKGTVPRADVTPFHARQIRGLADAALSKKLAEVWGELRDSDADKRARIAKFKTQFTPEHLRGADPGAGRAIFNTACAACHTLHGEGGKIGPDLTGSQRDNLDYLLENIVDPSVVVAADFRMSVVTMKDGRTLNGIIRASTDRTLTLQTMTEQTTVERAEISAQQESGQSLMPEGLLESLSEKQARDLIAYLMNSGQVPLPASAPSQ